MKHGKKPTMEQKKLLTAAGLDWHEWQVVNNLTDVLIVKDRTTGATRVIERS